MGSVAMWLEGPGQERRSVKLLSTETKHLKAGLSDGIRFSRPRGQDIELRTLIDDSGKIAKQTDFDGFRFKYQDSDIQWSLVFG